MAVNKGSRKKFEKPVAVRFYDHWFVQFFSILLKFVDYFFFLLIGHRWYMKLERYWFEGRVETDKTGFITVGWGCIRIDPLQLCTWMWKLDCFITNASCCHTCKLHLLGMRPQTATPNSWDSAVRMNRVSYNPKTLSWRFIFIEGQETALFSTKYVLDRISQ